MAIIEAAQTPPADNLFLTNNVFILLQPPFPDCAALCQDYTCVNQSPKNCENVRVHVRGLCTCMFMFSTQFQKYRVEVIYKSLSLLSQVSAESLLLQPFV